MKQYLDLLQNILDNGKVRKNRTGVDTIGIFGYLMKFDLEDGFPLLTTKKVFLRGVIEELLWFLKGSENALDLVTKNVHIWDQWMVSENHTKDPSLFGSIGPMYGSMWRKWPTGHGSSLDQIDQAIQQIKTNPFSRRIVVSAWNPQFLPDETLKPQANVLLGKQSLAPCHNFFQFYVEESEVGNKLSCMFNMRSSDAPIGLPFNIASYALLTMMVAQVCDLKPGSLIYTGGDVHIYSNQIEGVKTQLARIPRILPKLKLNTSIKKIDDFKYEDFILENYDPHPTISFPVAV